MTPPAPGQPAGWRLWRQDDHGNAFPVRDFRARDEAEDAANAFNAGGHHQLYWVAPVGEQDSPT